MNLILTDAANRIDDQDDDEDFFRDRCGRLIAECLKLNGVRETHFVGDKEPHLLTAFVNDLVEENSLRHVIAEIAETLNIVVDDNVGYSRASSCPQCNQRRSLFASRRAQVSSGCHS
jgi:hypothetical protein